MGARVLRKVPRRRELKVVVASSLAAERNRRERPRVRRVLPLEKEVGLDAPRRNDYLENRTRNSCIKHNKIKQHNAALT